MRIRQGELRLVLIDDPADILDGKVDMQSAAVVLLGHVSYRSGQLANMPAITAAVQRRC